MLTLVKRMAVMSVALILLCVAAVAQNEKSTKNVQNDNHGVIVSPNYVLLKPGEEIYVNVTVEEGYVNPLLIYAGESFDINDTFIFGEIFMAELLVSNSGGYLIRIIAYSDVDTIDSETIYVKAQIDYSTNRSTMYNYYGVPIIIVVDPDLKN